MRVAMLAFPNMSQLDLTGPFEVFTRFKALEVGLVWKTLDPVTDVSDRNRVTGAGVTSGIDFALSLCGKIFGEDEARAAQLGIEYDPQPPYDSGSPATADPALVARLRERSAPFQQNRDEAARRAAAALKA